MHVKEIVVETQISGSKKVIEEVDTCSLDLTLDEDEDENCFLK